MKEINDGGPAFPTTPVSHGYAPDTGGNGTGCGPGMTLRDWFAGQALANRNIEEHSGAKWADRVAEQAYRIADAMIAARNKPTE